MQVTITEYAMGYICKVCLTKTGEPKYSHEFKMCWGHYGGNGCKRILPVSKFPPLTASFQWKSQERCLDCTGYSSLHVTV